MSDLWIQECNEYIKQVRASLSVKNSDRLDLVKSMHQALLAINHSILGWLQYVNNPDIMSRFNREELNDINGALNKFALDFISHDIEVSKMGMEKGLNDLKLDNEVNQPFYV